MDEPDKGEPPAGPTDGTETPGAENDSRLAYFIRLLSDDDEVSRWKAAEALGRLKDPAAVDELISTLWDDDARVRIKASWALGQIGDRRAYAPLQRLYRMENETAQEIITEALENIRAGMSRQ
ncbi:MAG: HEAT repeat domain-containing protein [Methanoregulaceae archaeon]|nr:HEAT repeat domain-containing protein [Methanoregulaceae archaeon]